MLKFSNEDDYSSDSKYMEIKSLFENLFFTKSYTQDDYINSKVWFLKREDDFNIYINNNYGFSPRGNTNEKYMYKLLKQINLNQDLKNLKVSVGELIDKITYVLCNSYNIIEKTNENIIEYNSLEKSNEIEYTIAYYDII